MQNSLPPIKPKNYSVRTREYLTLTEIKRLKEAARANGRHSFRDWLLITTMYMHALRVGELTDLLWDQVAYSGETGWKLTRDYGGLVVVAVFYQFTEIVPLFSS